jgi:hypothetical protein
MFFCDNVGDKRGVVLPSTTPYANVLMRPRTSGIQVDYSFK